MNPEEMFRRLHDQSRWKVAPLSLPVRAVPRPKVVRRFVVPAIVIVAVTALFVGGVQTIRANVPASPPAPTVAPSPLPTGTPSPTPTSTSSAIKTVETGAWSSPPIVAFNGDCSSLFTDKQVAGFFGVDSMTLVDSSIWANPIDPMNAVVQHNGGIRCMWNDGQKQDVAKGTHPVLILVALSAETFPGATTGLDCSKHEGCAFTTGADGYILGGTIYYNGGGTASLDAPGTSQRVYEAVSAAFPASEAKQGPPPPIYAQRAGDWPTSIECAALFTDAGVAAALHRALGKATNFDSPDVPHTMQNKMISGHGMTECEEGDYGSSIQVEVLPGGAWLEGQITATKGVTPVSIDGADSAWTVTFAGEFDVPYLYVFDGPNLLVLSPDLSPLSTVQPAAAVLLKELDKRIATSASPGSYLTSEGLGDLRIGKPIPDDNGYVTWTPQGCTGGAWIPKPSTVYETDGARINKWGFLALPDPKNSHDEPLARILVSDASIPTKSGIRVGDTLADLKRTYGTFDAEYSQPRTGAHFYEINGSAGSVVFMLGGENYSYKAPADKIVVIGVVPAGEKLMDSAARMVQAPCDG